MQQTVPEVYFRLIFQIIMMVFQISVFFVVFFIIKRLKYTNIDFTSLIYTSLIYLFIYMQPSLAQSCFQLVACRDISGYSYLQADVSYLCYTAEYYAYVLALVMPVLIVILLVIPLLMFQGLSRAARENKLKNTEIRYKYGFLYNEVSNYLLYKKKFFILVHN